MSEVAIRHPKRGKAHRPIPHGNSRTYPNVEATACDRWVGAERKGLTERIPVEQTAPEDRCKRCWPNPT
jgi:hypothetical protein